MSFRVLVIPEDPTWNGYILRPLAKRLLRECGKERAIITVLADPRVQGIDHALRLLQDDKFQERYKHFDMWLFFPDADRLSDDRANALVSKIRVKKPSFFCCPAVFEVEVWLLAGHAAKLGLPWSSIRADRSPKENFFQPFLAKYGESRAAGLGRTDLMQQTLQNFDGLLAKCPELARLKSEIQDKLPRLVDGDDS